MDSFAFYAITDFSLALINESDFLLYTVLICVVRDRILRMFLRPTNGYLASFKLRKNSMKRFQTVLQLVCFAVIVVASSSQAFCQSMNYWRGGTYGDYLSPSNWDYGVPISTYARIGPNVPFPSTNIYFSANLTQGYPLEINGDGTEVTFDLRGNTLTIPSLAIGGGYYGGPVGSSVELDVTGGTVTVPSETRLYGVNRTLVIRDGGVLNTNSLNVSYDPASKVLIGPGGTLSFNNWGGSYPNTIEMDSGVLQGPSSFSAGYVRGNGVVVSSVAYNFSSVTGTMNLTQNLTVPAGQIAKVFSQGAAGLGPTTTLAPGSTLIAPAAGVVLGPNDLLTANNATISGSIALQSGILQADSGTPLTVSGGTISGYGVHLGNIAGTVGAPTGTVSLTSPLNVGLFLPSNGTVYSIGPASLAGGLFIGSGSTLSAPNGILLPGTAVLSGNGVVAGKVAADANSSIGATGTLSLGDATSYSGFRTAGLLNIGIETVNLSSKGLAQLGHTTKLNASGTLNAANGVSLGVGGNIVGSGTINARIAASTGSAIRAEGNLTLGNTSSPVGFASDGEIYTDVNTVTLFDSNQAVLGSFTQIGTGVSSGVLTAANGLLVDFGNNLVGQGTVNSTNLLAKAAIINGAVEGTGTGLTLTGYVKGVGTYAGNVTFGGTYSPGLSPASVALENMNLLSTSTLLVELAGTSPGSQFDVINLSGTGNLSGTLDVELLGGFIPQLGNSFDIINGTTSGTFGTLSLPSLSGGLSWDTSCLYNSGVISVVPEPGTIGLLLTGALAAMIHWRRRTTSTANGQK
jgi:hypothetical protein